MTQRTNCSARELFWIVQITRRRALLPTIARLCDASLLDVSTRRERARSTLLHLLTRPKCGHAYEVFFLPKILENRQYALRVSDFRIGLSARFRA